MFVQNFLMGSRFCTKQSNLCLDPNERSFLRGNRFEEMEQSNSAITDTKVKDGLTSR